MARRKRYGSTKSVLNSYLGIALWSSVGDDGEPLDAAYSISDIPKEEQAKAERDLDKFFAEADKLPPGDEGPSTYFENQDPTRVAHDFWLTRNGHGAGFWDGNYPEPLDTQLTKLAEQFGEVDLYVGDDGKLYFTRD